MRKAVIVLTSKIAGVLPFSLSIFCTRVTPRLWFYPTSWAKEGCFRRNEFQLSLVLLPQKHEVKRLKNTK
ncbi:hypothetical protein DWX82_02495 [Odoribacter sp. AF21-41]|nr:hypothetical protein DWX82_02495 [Odoribacter sp. AF21-41]RHH98413.1 hypothetical protein DW186_04095 [Odoribacter sp. AM16-33]